MQNTFAIFRGLSAMFVMLCFVTSCDLPVQPNFEFESEIGELPTFEDQTVLELGEIFAVLGVTAIDSLDAEGLDRLRNILNYHIIDDYVDQGPENLPVLLTNYFFQTLLSGDEGVISVHRDERFRMFINKEPLRNELATGLPSNARRAQVQNHNYVFSNGVGHQVRDYSRNRPF